MSNVYKIVKHTVLKILEQTLADFSRVFNHFVDIRYKG